IRMGLAFLPCEDDERDINTDKSDGILQGFLRLNFFMRVKKLEYGVLPSSGYGVLDLVVVVFGECRHRYAVSSLMDTAYWLSEQLYLMRRSLEVLRKFHMTILGGRFNQLSHVSSPLLSKPGEH
ncbi:hypothetical protein Tco_1342445, partial [Tanacetum coccineum]